jgi:hypothetical protein
LTRKSPEELEAEYLNRPGAGTHGGGRPLAPKKKAKRLDTDPELCDGPNATSLKAALAETAALERELDTVIEETATEEVLREHPELAAFAEQERKDTARAAAIHQVQIDAGQRPANPYAEIPEGEVGREQRLLRGGEPFPKPGDLPIAGEPDCSQAVWNLGSQQENERNELHARATQATLKLQWARREIERLRDKIRGTEQHSQVATELRAEIIAALKELRPLAVRNAKRGSPALLRLIIRAVKTKL